ncbi:MAG: SAM-dependent methyltransferase [Bacteroidetes bacterium]|nr:SAM-dependent methyltransferase [Bacteroidota bacterium]
MPANAQVYLIPCFIDEKSTEVLPAYILDAVKKCKTFFVENDRSARRYLKSLWKEMIIDNYEWFVIHENEEQLKNEFRQQLKKGNTIGIISEAGCPGVADPGQILISVAHEANAIIKPLVGPSSILLALMASGMNGQQFQFVGYLPIDNHQRSKKIKELENESLKKNCTQIFIETPYRNSQLLAAILNNCNSSTRLCIAVDITAAKENIRTKTISEWKKEIPDINKHPAIFLLLG